jgi:tetratricopeptide (TPR) repeat protein
LGRAAAAAGELAVLDSAVEATVAVPTSWDAVVNVLVVVGQELETHGYGNRAREVYRRAHDISVEQLPEENLYRAQAALRALPAEEALPTLERAAAAAPTESTGVLGLLALALERMGRSAEADELVERMWVANPRSRAPAAVAAARADGRGAAEAVRRALAAGQNYYTFGSLYWHHTPEFGVIREDPAWQSVMRPRD